MNTKVEMSFDETTLDQIKKCKELLNADSVEITISRAIGLLSLIENGKLYYKANDANELSPINVTV